MECKRCGTCCQEGGPALHVEDLELFDHGPLQLAHLITIRRGEPVFDPVQGTTGPARQELIKIAGEGESWSCRFFEIAKRCCTIHGRHPLECRLLSCSDTTAVEAVIERQTLTRNDLIAPTDPLRAVIADHEQRCPAHHATELAGRARGRKSSEALTQLAAIVRQDLAIRTAAVMAHHLQLALELFYFGRPILAYLPPFGLKAIEKHGRITVQPIPERQL
ncbi:MAG: YkgJ family cysteine cluster protein [Desulfobacteraceae bacterium]|nr:MAG: YkgJ family cysteine cluster protein [Desulfobacteraceae bacterium]